MDKYADELCRQIITESTRETFVNLLMMAASYGYGMENRKELEELAEFLSEEVVRDAERKGQRWTEKGRNANEL